MKLLVITGDGGSLYIWKIYISNNRNPGPYKVHHKWRKWGKGKVGVVMLK